MVNRFLDVLWEKKCVPKIAPTGIALDSVPLNLLNHTNFIFNYLIWG